MNRALVFGIAIFFAVVGIALMGGDNKVLAGHGHGGGGGCMGCDGYACGGAPACAGPADCCAPCGGRRHHGHRRHHQRRNNCCGNPCCGPVAPACCGYGGGYGAPAGGMGPGGQGPAGPEAAPPAAPEAPPAPGNAPSAGIERSRVRLVRFRG
ncbi:MAG TPA: hypothetical protein VFW87_11395 [Pirellulales bacterium]|nr:hypothetical protein [Pirellulales bacterium]